MNRVSKDRLTQMQQAIAAYDADYTDWRPHHQEVARYILPRRYSWLYANSTAMGSMSKAQSASRRNEFILDGTATIAVNILAAGMMNGITSPARPWFRLRFKGFEIEHLDIEARRWLEEVARRMQTVMNESNFYNCMATLYLDLVAFGTAAALFYEDFDDIIRCYNMACGEYRLVQDDRRVVSGCARIIDMTLAQIVKRWGLDSLPPEIRAKFALGGAALQHPYTICHLIEPNDDRAGKLNLKFSHREYYWLKTDISGQMLEIAGYHEIPGIFPRWLLMGNDTYGTSPSMDALPDIIQLQHITKRKAQSLDYMIQPPMIADASLQNKPSAFLPRSVTFVPSASTVGAKPAYQINPPIAEITADIREVQFRVKNFYHNDLFQMISQLDTVRTAAEIDGRREEKLTMLGPVYQRFENEALDPAIQRIFNIMRRKDLFPPIPPQFADAEIEVQYVSVLADAQRAVGTGSIERFMQVVGQVTPAVPEVGKIPDWTGLIRDYADRLNVPATGIKPRAQVEAEAAAAQAQIDAQQAALVGDQLTNAGKNLSETDVGGGQNALQALMGG